MPTTATDTRDPGTLPVSTFRTDIEGLRGFAVLLVVLFHIGIADFAGGFVGVDVFFVISGYLISRQLFGETERTGGASLRRFWANRLRRLTPLLFVTVLGTTVAGLFVYSPLGWDQLAHEGTASALYVSNVLFASDGQAYFQSGASPFLQTWSLGVEEQFYILWPLLFVCVAALVRRSRLTLRSMFAAAIAVTTSLSFVVGVLLTRRGTPWAFYSAPSRAWEFGIGALAFIATPIYARSRPAVLPIAGWLGVALVCASALSYDEFTPMPGTAAILPVAGTALVIIAGVQMPHRVAAGRVLSVRPLRSLGRVSYAWYLLHWPAIVLVAAATTRDDRATLGAAAVASLLVAYVATRWIERPVRESRFARRPPIVYASAAAATLLLVGVTVAVSNATDRRLEDPYLAHLVSVRSGRSTSGSEDCSSTMLSHDVTACVYGPDRTMGLVVLAGDSHAAQWAPAVERATAEMGYRLIVRAYGGCPAVDVFVARTGFTDASDACLAYREETQRILEAGRPDLVVLSNTDYSGLLLRSPEGGRLDAAETAEAYRTARIDFATRVAALGARLAVIEDNPIQDVDPIECLALHHSPARCSSDASDVVPAVDQRNALERETFADVGPIKTMPVVPLICDHDRCLVERDDLNVYSDSTHLSGEFTEAMWPRVSQLIEQALA